MTDLNHCLNCDTRNPLNAGACRSCGSSVVRSAYGAISLWILGDSDFNLIGNLASEISLSLGCPVVIQPCRMDMRPSHRPTWKGRSSTAILNQVLRRHQPGSLASIAITEENIVSSPRENFLLGYAYMRLPSACVSLHAIRLDSPPSGALLHRAQSICLHELGHTFGLDEHALSDRIDCCMVGEVPQGGLFDPAVYPKHYCDGCLRVARQAMADFGAMVGPIELAEGRLFGGRYMLEEVLGEGGLGRVWRARDIMLNQDVAIKFVAADHFVGRQEVQLREEASRVRGVWHSHIVPVHDVVTDGGTSGLVMGLVDRSDLDFLQSQRPSGFFSEEEIAPWVRQLCEAVSHAHGEGLIHQDIKPSNCIIDSKNRLHLSDFGVSRMDQAAHLAGAATASRGTLGFAPPEQLAGAPSSPLHDIYAIGATIYSLLTGIPPRVHVTHFGWRHGAAYASISTTRQSRSFRQDCPPEWEMTVERCVALDPRDRPSSAADIIEMLNLPPIPVASTMASRAGMLRRLWRRWRGLCL